MAQNTKGLKGQGHTSRSSVKVTDLLHLHCICYCWISTRNLKMMLLLDFAVAIVNCTGGKKTHGNHFNNNTDREYLSVSTSRSVITLTLPGPSAGASGSLDSYCSLKPLCSGMGEVVLARTSLTLLPHPLALGCHYPVSKCCSASIVVTSTVRVNLHLDSLAQHMIP